MPYFGVVVHGRADRVPTVGVILDKIKCRNSHQSGDVVYSKDAH